MPMKPIFPKGRILSIAGSDSGGGAGIQADIKTITALGGYAMTAITALTAQNTQAVQGIYPVPESFVKRQIQMVIDDLGVDAIKTGMLANAGMIDMLVDIISGLDVPVVVDPVMVAKGGAVLLDPSAISSLTQKLFPHAYLITPNLPEAALLLNRTIKNVDNMLESAKDLLSFGSQAVLLKGGHLLENDIYDVLITQSGQKKIFKSPRLKTLHTHGTGCTLSAAIATYLAQGLKLKEAIEQARAFVWHAILQAPGFGKGHGPLNHQLTVQPFRPTSQSVKKLSEGNI